MKLKQLMVFGTVAVCGEGFINYFSIKASADTVNVGDIIEFGTYPQSKVSDDTLVSKLTELSGTPITYNYYYGNGDIGSMFPSNYMKYYDVSYRGEKYRAVIIDSFRPWSTFYELPITSIKQRTTDKTFITVFIK